MRDLRDDKLLPKQFMNSISEDVQLKIKDEYEEEVKRQRQATLSYKLCKLFANNKLRYLTSSLIGANLVYIVVLLCTLLVDFIFWNGFSLSRIWSDLIIDGWTTGQFRFTTLCWLVFGHWIYYGWSQDYKRRNYDCK